MNICGRADVAQLLHRLLEPVLPRATAGDAGFHLGDFAAHYGEGSAHMEAFSRMLWGLAPLWAAGEGREYLPVFRTGLVNGVDPRHPAYWGDPFDYDQKIVEMAAVSLTILLCGRELKFSEEETANLHTWMGKVNGADIPKNNWFFFRVLVNAAFRRMGWAWDELQVTADLARIDGWYLSGGWYSDGPATQMDYYIPFGMHFYGLIYASCMEDLDPGRCRVFKERAAAFAPDFLYWFEDGGRAVPFGRSLTYRFSQCAFFAALAFADVEALPWGVLKGRVLGNLRDWFAQPILTDGGLLSVGYSYPNLFMSENYNAPGSPYWAFKAFLCLALPEEHPFWTAEEVIPSLAGQKALPQARMLLCRDARQVQMFVAGQHCVNQLGNCASKYEKLVYSTRFGFSIPRGESLEEGAYDNGPVFSEAGEGRYRMARGFSDWAVSDTSVSRTFSPLRGVEVTVTVTPDFPRHRREYRVTTDRPIDMADAGFAIPAEWEGRPYTPDMVTLTDRAVAARFPWGTSAIHCEAGRCEPLLVKAYPNTNLLFPLTRIPTLLFRLEAGTHRIVTVVTGDVPT